MLAKSNSFYVAPLYIFLPQVISIYDNSSEVIVQTDRYTENAAKTTVRFASAQGENQAGE